MASFYHMNQMRPEYSDRNIDDKITMIMNYLITYITYAKQYNIELNKITLHKL